MAVTIASADNGANCFNSGGACKIIGSVGFAVASVAFFKCCRSFFFRNRGREPPREVNGGGLLCEIFKGNDGSPRTISIIFACSHCERWRNRGEIQVAPPGWAGAFPVRDGCQRAVKLICARVAELADALDSGSSE